MSIRTHAARLDLGARVTLYDIDLSELGGGIQRFTPMNQVLGTKGVTRLNPSGRSGVERVFPLPANTSRKWYVKMIIKREAAPNWFSIVGFSSGASTVYKAIDPAGVRSAVDRNNSPANMGVIEAVQYVAQGDYVIFGFAITAVGNNWITDFRIMPNGGSASSSWNSNSASVTGSRLDVVHVELWQEPTLNNLQKLSDGDDYEDEQYMVATTIQSDEAFAPLRWRGNNYQALPVEAEGFEVSGKGAHPRPRMRMSNVLGMGTTLSKQFNDLLGAKVTRWRTFSRFLDDGITPDPNAHLPVDVYYVDMKARHTKTEVEWELASILDQQGILLPGRQVLRHGCQLQYRVWDGSAFDYQDVSCPYVGANYFNAQNQPVANPAQDQCNHQLSGCLRRFTGASVPFGGFPMVGRIAR